LRLREQRSLNVGVGGFLCAMTLGYFFNGYFMFAVYAVVALWFSAPVAEFRCPRCGKRFYNNGWMINQWSGRCLNCGLVKGSDPLEE